MTAPATQTGASTTLRSLTRQELIFPRLTGADGPAVLRELSERLAERGVVADADELYRLLQEREALGSTGIGSGVAVPHCKVKGLSEVLMAVGVKAAGVDFESEDGEPVRLFFLLLSPQAEPAAHLRSLAAISRWVQLDDHVEQLLACEDAEEIFARLEVDREEDEPPATSEPATSEPAPAGPPPDAEGD